MPVHLTGTQLDNNYFASSSIAAPVSVVGASSAAATTCMTTTFALERDALCLIECMVPFLALGTTSLDIELRDGATFLTSLSGHMVANIPRPGCIMFASLLLKAGLHTLNVNGFVDAGAGTFGAGSGVSGAAPPALLFVGPE